MGSLIGLDDESVGVSHAATGAGKVCAAAIRHNPGEVGLE